MGRRKTGRKQPANPHAQRLLRPVKIWVYKSGHVVIGVGNTPEGAIPVYGCDTQDQAESLVVATCKLAYDGSSYVAPEVATHGTVESLSAFTDRLEAVEQLRAAKARRRAAV